MSVQASLLRGQREPGQQEFSTGKNKQSIEIHFHIPNLGLAWLSLLMLSDTERCLFCLPLHVILHQLADQTFFVKQSEKENNNNDQCHDKTISGV
jgi:hypothetical protein